ncbi:MAG: hypothetical protein GY850_14860 [bacterium]|nr:hypothetical protein [bacterium]
MNIDNKHITAFATPFVLALLVWFSNSLISFKPALTTLEYDVVNYHSENLQLPEARSVTYSSPVNSPLVIKAASTPPPETTPAPAPRQTAVHDVTMIVTGPQEKMAVIDGVLLREGDKTSHIILKQVERTKVQATFIERDTGGKEKTITLWLYLEDQP